ncbi:MAG: ABC transporter permease [Rhizobiaceae bacterium]|nr:ABC transporter permease [Rhizobiaceae bacterium]
MLRYIVKKAIMAVLVAVTVTVIAFLLLHVSGDLAVAMAGQGAPPEEIEAIRRAYGFDHPIIIQYMDWVLRALQGDLGSSYFFRVPVTELIVSRLPITFILGVFALAFALSLGMLFGILAALWQNTWVDRLLMTISVIGQALPSFWFALLLIIFFGVQLGWLPISGTDTWQNFVLPVVTLGFYALPAFMRLTRAGMIEVMGSDYIRTARAKGLRPASVIFKHALRNAVIPVASVAPVQFGFMLGGSVVIETVFTLNGLGYLAWESISRVDFPVVQAIVLILALIYVVLTLIAEMIIAFLDPRSRVE